MLNIYGTEDTVIILWKSNLKDSALKSLQTNIQKRGTPIL